MLLEIRDLTNVDRRGMRAYHAVACSVAAGTMEGPLPIRSFPVTRDG